MSLAGVDCSHPISGAALAAANKEFVFRYDATSTSNPKVATRAEIEDHLAHGIAEGVVFEDGNYSVTPAQARTAVAHAEAIGRPKGTAIFMACDEHPAPGSAFADMVASATVIRAAGFLAGWYGEKDTARQLQGGGHVDAVWVVDTWGTTQDGDHWNFRQLPNSPNETIGGVDCDVDDAPFPVGLWQPPPARSAQTPKVKPMYDPPIPVPPIVASRGWPGDTPTKAGAHTLHSDGSVDNWGGAPLIRGVNGQPWFVGQPAGLCGPDENPPGVDRSLGNETAAGKLLVVFNTAGQRYALPI